tara:strand:- start:427 stop:612 length:186 start_codon:yes stop_codon:yes gene_type:complete
MGKFTEAEKKFFAENPGWNGPSEEALAKWEKTDYLADWAFERKANREKSFFATCNAPSPRG